MRFFLKPKAIAVPSSAHPNSGDIAGSPAKKQQRVIVQSVIALCQPRESVSEHRTAKILVRTLPVIKFAARIAEDECEVAISWHRPVQL